MEIVCWNWLWYVIWYDVCALLKVFKIWEFVKHKPSYCKWRSILQTCRQNTWQMFELWSITFHTTNFIRFWQAIFGTIVLSATDIMTVVWHKDVFFFKHFVSSFWHLKNIVKISKDDPYSLRFLFVCLFVFAGMPCIIIFVLRHWNNTTYSDNMVETLINSLFSVYQKCTHWFRMILSIKKISPFLISEPLAH